MSYKFLGLIEMNESEFLIASTVGSATIGWPDFNMLIIDTMIKGISEISFLYYILLIFKLFLAVSSFYWLYKLILNIEFTYRYHNESTFNNYILNLLLVGVAVFIASFILGKILY